MRQHRKGVTSSSTESSGLDLRCKGDSNFLHSINSHQMVKNVYASQEYFQWDIFLTFTCNTRKKIGSKPISEWLYNNKWEMKFPKWGTYSFFCQQEIKISLHQSTSGLFLRVLEEVITIFIDYLIISLLSPFLDILGLFSRKEYQAYIGNISHIHLLEKIRQLYEQSQTKLCDLISDNVVDIIKP